MTSKYERIAIVSSGDQEQDEKELASARRSMALMDEGLCPNGCGPRIPAKDPRFEGCSECPSCGFFCNRSAE